MNKNINQTLELLVPVLQSCHAKIKSIEAVRDWFSDGKTSKKYMKEVAELEYEDGYRLYVDINGDSNIAAVYDVVAVLMGYKGQAGNIQEIERGVYGKSNNGNG